MHNLSAQSSGPTAEKADGATSTNPKAGGWKYTRVLLVIFTLMIVLWCMVIGNEMSIPSHTTLSFTSSSSKWTATAANIDDHEGIDDMEDPATAWATFPGEKKKKKAFFSSFLSINPMS